MSNVESRKAGQKPVAKSVVKQAHSKVAEKATTGQGAKGSYSKAQRGSTVIVFSYRSADDKDLLNIIDLVRSGITYQDFNKLMDHTPFSMSEWASYLQLSERTMQRNQKEKKAFQPIQSERIVELAMLYQYGLEVFGDQNNFDTWLDTKSVALGGSAPKELLDTKFGITMVKDALTRIEHGVLA